jgi:AAA+ ATPase superfamily predicted ATPase
MKFYDRDNELALIRKAMEADHAMVVVYGRRRVGKTRLVREALAGVPHIDIFIPRKRTKPALEYFRASLAETEGFSPSFSSIDEFLRYLLLKTDKIVFLDEIGNFQFVDSSAYSVIQQIFDQNKQTRPLRLIFSGSYVGLMKKIFSGRKEPLFGRATNLLELGPLPLTAAISMIMDRGFAFEDAVGVWCIAGGVPRYIESAEGKTLENYIRTISSPGSIMVPEGENTLVQEFGRKWETHFAILEQMGRGLTRPNEIAQGAGINPLALPKYLAQLEGLNLVERSRPVLGKERYIRYDIKDNFFRFWFHFIYPRLEDLRSGFESRPDMALVEAYLGRMAERFVAELIRTRRPFEFERLGPWWSRKGDEIDLIAARKKGAIFIEVKWSKKKVEWPQVEALVQKSSLVEKARSFEKGYLVVSRSSFAPSCIELMDELGIMHWDCEKMKELVLG